MELFSLHFLLFLAVSLAAYHVVGHIFRNYAWVVLLVASLAFYCLVGRWQTLAYMVACALVTWAAPLALARMDAACGAERAAAPDRAARKAARARWAGRRRAVLVAALVACLGMLAYLKYWNVIIYEVGLAPSPASLGLALPLGISFYTFQSASYLVDAYNGRFEPQRNPLKHLLFVSWFPQVIQGPINRYEQLGPQLVEYHEARSVRYDRSILRFGYGALKKIAIANMLVGTIDQIFSNVTPGIPGSVVAFGILLYSAQQYGDFSGGIDMVEAASSLFGVEMAENFRRPYFSSSLADFWRRWHITLGAWMRDYVFFPLAVSRPVAGPGRRASARRGGHLGRPLPACVANIVVFLVVGVWHGAEPHYVAWGLYNGVVIAAADLLAPAFRRADEALRVGDRPRAHHLFRVLRTFLVVNVGWYFDRVYDLGDSLLCLRNTVANFPPPQFLLWLAQAPVNGSTLKFLASPALACLGGPPLRLAQERGVDADGRILGWNCVARGLFYSAAIGLIVVASFLTQNASGGFMYANF
ncbi:MBOAT family protein [Olsenella sp. Marseille-P4559]|uniref:MBOAT family O-acyltransferase n=1 Tax=Olsenella sp. Marseille-P4559 TaxID=2364795 RepID=UPI00102F97DB|nr:MBOAT family O-acyltransferase [Olsenella sp. Marseille-P4559]